MIAIAFFLIDRLITLQKERRTNQRQQQLEEGDASEINHR